ncbi:uncharacterized protein isoform X2 [Musca autumnalis]|uniref:uncharacterized protein isoform X2 n=1 Tax=Musca autumnalis TaxID=221902 RepID=UPI003CF773C2
MFLHLSNSKRLIIANKTPIYLKSFQNLRNPVNFIVTLRPNIDVIPRNIRHRNKYWSPRSSNEKTQKVLIESEDIFKGKDMLESNRLSQMQSLEKIEEEPELDSSADNNSYELKFVKSLVDLERLYGGCLSKKESDENNSKQPTDEKFLSKSKQEPQINSLKPNNKTSSTSRSNKWITCPSFPCKKRKLDDGKSECNKIEFLEEEIVKLANNLNEVRQNMSNSADIEKISTITKQLQEVNDILKELKLSCLRLEQTLIERHQSLIVGPKEPSNNENLIESAENKQSYSQDHKVSNERMSIKKAKENVKNRGVYFAKGETSEVKICGSNRNDSEMSERRGTDAEYFFKNAAKKHSVSPRESFESLPAHSYHSTTLRPSSKMERVYSRSIHNSPCHSQIKSNSCRRPCCEQNVHSIPMRYFNTTGNHCPSCEFQESHQTSHNKYRYRRTPAGNECEMPFPEPKTSNQEFKSLCSSDSNGNISYVYTHLPVIKANLLNIVFGIIGTVDPAHIALTVILQSNDIYHINISVTNTGQSLGDVYATEAALQQAEQNYLLDQFLTFFVLNSNNTLDQKNRILGHSFEFINLENSQQDSYDGRIFGNENITNLSDHSFRSHKSEEQPHNMDDVSDKISNKSVRLKAGNHIENLPQTERNNTYEIDNKDEKLIENESPLSGLDNVSRADTIRNEETPKELPLEYVKYYNYNKRLDNLEHELKNMRHDLRKLNEKLLPQNKWSKLQEFGEKLKSLHALLEALKNSSKTSEANQNIANTPLDYGEHNEPHSQQCQRFSAEINRHPTLLEKYLLTLKDFRTDAELRRQRLEKRWQEKLLQKQQQQQTDNFDTGNKLPRKLSDIQINQFVENVVRKVVEVPLRHIEEKYARTQHKDGENDNEVDGIEKTVVGNDEQDAVTRSSLNGIQESTFPQQDNTSRSVDNESKSETLNKALASFNIGSYNFLGFQ